MSRSTRGIVVTLSLLATPALSQEHQHPSPPATPGQHQHAMGGMGGMMMQAESTAGRRYAWFFSAGGQNLNWGDVQSAFTAAGYSRPGRAVLQLGGGGYGVRGRLVLGGEGYGYAGQSSASPGGRETRVTGGAGFFNLGYLVLDRPTVRAYPMIGLGGSSVTFEIDAAGGTGLGPNVNDPTFGQVLQDPGRRSRLTAGGFAMEIGAGLDFIPVSRRRAGGSSYGLLVGIRAGFQFTPVRGDWMLYDADVVGGPDDVGNGLYVRVSIGGSGSKVRARGCPHGM